LGDELPICFVPISIRYQTNTEAVFYQALAARLADILGETLPQAANREAFKDKAIEYLGKFGDGRRCLIVIDGLDEAAGWEVNPAILPPEPHAGIRVVTAARQLAGDQGPKGWLERLGWDRPRSAAKTMEVPALTRDGITNVLENMDFALEKLPQDLDLVGELFQLTENGDPLLLNLYVYDLWPQREHLQREDLAGLKPGYEGYFEKWFRDQKRLWKDAEVDFQKELIDVLLIVLSCALGPMKLDALSSVVQRLLGKDLLITKQTVEPLNRFVVGDGVNTGFAFAHPKLADFVRRTYIGEGKALDDGREAIVEYCRSIVLALNSGDLDPASGPDYVLLHYVEHLKTSPPKELLMHYRELVENGWRSAWLAHEEGLAGFARDLEAVWAKLRQAAEENPDALKRPKTGLGGLIRCTLCLSSIRSLGSSLPTNFLAELFRQRIITASQALHFSRLKPPWEQVDALAALGNHLSESDIEKAMVDARQIPSLDQRGLALAVLANRLPEPRRSDLLTEALNTAQSHPDDFERGLAVETIESFRMPSRPADTVESTPGDVAEGIPHTHWAASATPPDIEAAFKHAIQDVDSRAFEIMGLAPFLPVHLLAESLDICLDPEALLWQTYLGAVAPYLKKCELLERALNIAGGWKHFLSDYHRARVLHALAPYLPPPLLERALNIAFLQTGDHREEAIGDLLPHLPLPLFTTTVKRLSLGRYSWRKTLELAGPHLRAEYMEYLIKAIGKNIPNLDAILPFIPDADRRRTVAAAYTTPEIGDHTAVVETLCALSSTLPETQAQQAINSIWTSVRKLTTDANRALALVLLSSVSALAREKRRELFDDAKSLAAGIPDRGTAMTIRCALALSPEICESEMVDIVSEFLHSIGFSDSAWNNCAMMLLRSGRVSKTQAAEISKNLISSLRSKSVQVFRPESFIISAFIVSAMLSEMAPDDARLLFNEALELLSQGQKPNALAYAIASVSPFASSHDAGRFREAAITIAHSVDDEMAPAFLATSSPLNEDMSSFTLLALDRSRHKTRAEALKNLEILRGGQGGGTGLSAPVTIIARPQNCLEVVGGPQTASEAYEAIRDVVEWWP
jgi:hypothetical protein